ncbi:MAG: flavin reductase family protein [Sulfobacillus thermotolerans]|uniref:Flavin reductase like domain-containing protein n=1 Tax=Sulfobacillus thermotolerans TaxID=338644 RepID=A0ABM6RU36_9FIRM|nr:hypothetical protein BXT84_13325 [Sulfobacillus thermotolerans]MCY0906824.1 flavin reductase family protein [Sulfobacillus thermotolerans]
MTDEEQQRRARHFRQACGRFATGVTVLTATDDDHVHAMTANAFMSVSLDPLLIATAVSRSAKMLPILQRQRHFAVSILNHDQQYWSDKFGGRGLQALNGLPIPVPFCEVSAPYVIMEQAAAWFLCTAVQEVEAGDHVLLLARVEDFGTSSDIAKPLVFFGGRYYHRLDEERDAEGLLLEL